MKINLSFKTPDVIEQALEDVPDELHDKVREICETIIEYDECLTVEIDTRTGRARILPV